MVVLEVYGVLGHPFFIDDLGGFDMKYRSHVNKHKSSRKFRGQAGRTKAANVKSAPMRGGIRL